MLSATFFKSDFQERLHVALKDEADEQFFYPETDPEYITLILPLQNPQGEKTWHIWGLYAPSMKCAAILMLPSVIW